MDPIAANIQSILNAIQAASSAQSLPTLETPALSAMLGLGQPSPEPCFSNYLTEHVSQTVSVGGDSEGWFLELCFK